MKIGALAFILKCTGKMYKEFHCCGMISHALSNCITYIHFPDISSYILLFKSMCYLMSVSPKRIMTIIGPVKLDNRRHG